MIFPNMRMMEKFPRIHAHVQEKAVIRRFFHVLKWSDVENYNCGVLKIDWKP